MPQQMVRILMAKIGEGGGDAIVRLSKAFRDAGFEVIYTETQKPSAIVASAIQEAVDHIGITTFPGADLEQLGEIKRLLVAGNDAEIGVTAGGVMNAEDIPEIKRDGHCGIFPRRYEHY